MSNLLLNILFAFIGGMIMNFMPCILPLISLKISSFISVQNKDVYLKKNLFYTFGILSFFFGLAVFLSFLKFGSKNIIFGSHMQSGLFLFLIYAILILIGFNLSGLFEFNLHSVENKSSNFLFKFSGFLKDYFNGFLASILAIPCTAPFIATAFTFALSTNYINIFLITIFMGIGFALPFIIAIIFPKYILKIIPKPGAWMEKFKILMSFPIFATALWILFIMIKQNNLNYTALSLFFTILSYFFIWFWKNFSYKTSIKLLILGAVLIFSYFIFPFENEKNLQNKKEQILNQNSSFSFNYGQKQSFSNEKLEFYKKNKTKILIVASASWCLTCHVNEKNALSSEEFFDKLKEKEVIYLYIDLTNKNPEGEKFLKIHNQIGIPYYLTINENGLEKQLPQVLNSGLILKLIDEI